MKKTMMWLLSLSLISGTTMVLLSKHWFSMWMGLELSTISIMPLLNTKKTPRSSEATLKYFLIQAFSASMLLMGATLNLWLSKSWKMKDMKNSPMCKTIILSAIMMKLGMAPGHFWFPDILSGIPFLKSIIMACWQKMAPFFLLSSMNFKSPKEMTMISGTMSMLMGGWGGLNQTSMRKMLGYSSMGQLGWMTITSFYSPETALALLTFYLLMKTSMFLMCHKTKLPHMSNLKKTKMIPTSSILMPMMLLSLGGLPPFGGFMNKLIPFNMLMKNKKMMMMPFLILGSLLSLFYYIRMMMKTKLMLFPNKSMNMVLMKTELSNKLKMMMSSLAPISIMGIFLIPMMSIFY